MKKTLCLALLFLFALSSLVACSSTNVTGLMQDKTSQQLGTSETAGDYYDGNAPVTDETVILTWLANNSHYSAADLAQSMVIAELQKRTNVHLDLQLLPPATYIEAVKPRLAAGTDLPDVVSLPDMDEDMKYIQASLFLPISDLYDMYGFNMKKLYEGGPLEEIKASLTATDGNMYYVPVISLDKENAPCLMINKRWLDKLDLEVPSTLDEYYEVLQAFRQGDPNGNGEKDEVPLVINTVYLKMLFGPTFGLDLLEGFYADKDGKIHYSYIEPAYKELLIYLNKLYVAELLDYEFATLNFDMEVQRFSQDLGGAYGAYSWHMSKTISPLYDDYDGQTPIMMGIPPLKGSSGEQFYWAVNKLAGIYGITQSCSNPEVAYKFMDYVFASEEAADLMYWGIEGETYHLENGKKIPTEHALDNDFRQKSGIDPVCVPRRQDAEAIRAMFDPWHAEIDIAMEKYYENPFPFVYALKEESDLLNQYITDIDTLCDEMFINFVTGIQSLSDFDGYVQSLKNLNIDELIKAKQDQYDRYKANLN